MGPLTGMEIYASAKLTFGSLGTYFAVRFVIEKENSKIRIIKSFWEVDYSATSFLSTGN